MKNTIPSSKKDRIIRTITSCLGPNDNIISAYIFGSFVSDGPFSDIDLGILVRHEDASPFYIEMNLANEIEKQVAYAIDIRLLNRAPLFFCQNVIRKGRVILDKDPNLRSEFEGRILKEYFDFSIFRRRYLEEVIYAPV